MSHIGGDFSFLLSDWLALVFAILHVDLFSRPTSDALHIAVFLLTLSNVRALSSVLLQISPLSTASLTSMRGFVAGASRTPSPTPTLPRVGTGSTDEGVQSEAVAEVLPAASGTEGQAKQHSGAAVPSPEKAEGSTSSGFASAASSEVSSGAEDPEGEGQKAPAASEGAGAEGRGAITVPSSFATTPTVTQRWPYARAISRAPERSRGSRSGSDSSSSSPGLLVSSGDR